MNPEEVKQRLTTYRVERGALDGLLLSRTRLVHELHVARQDRLETLAGPRAQVITDMPHGTTVGNPTERAALAMVEDSPEETRIKASIADIDAKATELANRCNLVEAWMRMLNDRERYVIENSIIKRMPWTYVAHGYEGTFGIALTERQLINVRGCTLKLIYKAAELVV